MKYKTAGMSGRQKDTDWGPQEHHRARDHKTRRQIFLEAAENK
jgi:hypothetical protein